MNVSARTKLPAAFRARRGDRGQVLPLACVSLIFLALMTMLSFNIANVVHEKIRLQNYSDAQAFSMGTYEARAFNYLAYSNRASAAAFVTLASLHGFYAIANMSPQLLRAAGVAMGVEALAELGVCIASWGTTCCNHVPKPVQMAIQFAFTDANDAEDVLEEWERPFNDAVQGLWNVVGLIHLEQDLMLGAASATLVTGFSDNALKDTAPQASQLPPAVAGINAYNFMCSTEGAMLDVCSAKKTTSERAKIFTEIINASRPEFAHHIGQMGTDYLPMIGDKWSDLTYSLPAFYGGEHAIGDDSCNPQPGHEGELACGDVPFAAFVGSAEDLPGVGAWVGSEIVSDDGGGDHSPSGAHTGQHSEFRGIPNCVQDKRCFINFRADDEDNDWGQPSVYGYFSSDLTKRPGSQATPWILGTDGKLTMDLAAQSNGSPGVLQMTPTRAGAAMSRAMVYFHAPGSWPRPANFFDPYWSSKLHPFDRLKQGMVLGASADGDKIGDLPMAIVVEGDL